MWLKRPKRFPLGGMGLIHSLPAIVISTTDYFELAAYVPLSECSCKSISSIRPTLGELPKRDLEEGKVDLAVARFYRDLPEGFFQAKLFNDSFASARSSTHPRGPGSRRFFFGQACADYHGVKGKPKNTKIPYGSFSFSAMA